jgi:hypothetical protein
MLHFVTWANNELLSIFMEVWESHMDNILLPKEFKWILEMNFFGIVGVP